MLRSLRKLIIFALLLVMPLQGVAASLTDSLCEAAPGQMELAHTHSHDGNDGAPHEHEGNGHTAAHLCCHHFFAAIPVVAADPGNAERPAFEPQHRHSAWAFFPEQPQPVPLA